VIYEFGGCTLDADRILLTSGDDSIPLEPQVYDLLLYLLENRGTVVTKEQLLDNVWGDRFVSESALTTRIKSVRRAVGDSGSKQAVIRTVHGKGYEFVAEVQITDQATAARPDGVAVGGSLPQPLTDLIGREETLRQLRSELQSSRLITLIGPGGVGKTSLAYQVCREVASGFPDGVWPVELVALVDVKATVEAVATALDVHAMQGRTVAEAVIDVMQDRSALILLDNCEHVTGPISDLVGELLRSAPGVSILATSREPLGLPAEQIWPVYPLAVGVTEADEIVRADAISRTPAIELFVDRAMSADPEFRLTDDNAPAVAEICRRLDGIPLAIELAAARVRALDVTEIADRLDERFRLLKGVRRGADPRHQALEDTVAWSFELLDPEEQHLFRRLSVFSGPFDLAAAEAVCDFDGQIDVLDGLTRLADRSMVAVRRTTVPLTYEVLESLKAFGTTRLDDAEKVGLFTAHAEHFCSVAEAVGRGLVTGAEADWNGVAGTAFADLRAAVGFAVETDTPALALPMVSSIREYCMRSMRYEVIAWADTALGMQGSEESPAFPVVLAVAAYGAWVRGDFETALTKAESVLERAGTDDHAAIGLAARTKANVKFLLGNIDEGFEACALLLTAASASGDPSQVAHANYMTSCAHSSMGQVDSAHQHAGVAHEAAATTQSPTDAAGAWFASGLAFPDDDPAALDAFTECDRLAASVGNRWMSAFARTELNSLLLRSGQTEAACEGMADVIDTWFRSGDWSQQWLALSKSIPALVSLGSLEQAAELIGAVQAHASVAPPPANESIRQLTNSLIGEIEQALGTDRYRQRTREGAALPIERVVHRTRAALTP
jgi:predicted ATPase/DNA-binding winged helix-turn-helix (wHTH) protein